jgi:ABC-type sugar transport system permease subunit
MGKKSIKKKRNRAGFLFIVPALLLFLVFLLYPLISNISLSLYDVKFSYSGLVFIFIKLQNYINLINDPKFWDAVMHSILWALWAIIVDIPIAFILAILLSEKIRGWRLFRTIWFLPRLLSYVFVALIWGWILNWDWGFLNNILRYIGLGSLVTDWLGNTKTALVSLMIIQTWCTTGFNMVLLLGGISGIPDSIFDQIKIDGCNWFQKTYYVIIPMIKRILITTLQLAVIGKLHLFELVFIATGGGPFGSTETVVSYLIRRSYFWRGEINFGYSASISVIWAFIIITITIILNKLFQEKEILEY